MRVARRGVGMLAALLLCVGTACAGGNAGTAGPTGTRSNATSTSPSTSIPDVLDFEAPLLDGGTFQGQSLAGKDVAFWFWAPW